MSGFSKLTDEMFDVARDCGPAAFTVWCYLLRRLGSNDACWPRQSTIADGCSLHVRTVIRSLQSLESVGYLKIIKTGRASSYELLVNSPEYGWQKVRSDVTESQIRCDRKSDRAGNGALLEREPGSRDPLFEKLFGRGGSKNGYGTD